MIAVNASTSCIEIADCERAAADVFRPQAANSRTLHQIPASDCDLGNGHRVGVRMTAVTTAFSTAIARAMLISECTTMLSPVQPAFRRG